jgi:hypothetical protein
VRSIAFCREVIMRIPRRELFLSPLAALSMSATATMASAQELGSSGTLQAIRGVEFVAPRMDGPPALVLFTEKTRLQPASGTYVSRDRATLVVRDGRIVEVADSKSSIGRLRVATVDEVAARHGATRPRVYIKDAGGRTAALPDGEFRSETGQILVVREGTIVGYDPGPAFPVD